tara:strand:+ start:1590 stop:3380 length:1791 start_codon:yes stop_codon:yes gene_type:complete
MEKEDLNNFFPTENFSDIKISQLEAKNLSDNLKFFYINNLQLFKKIFDDKFPFKFQEILINRAISPITYIFFERFLRAYKYNKNKNGNYSINKSFYKFKNNIDMEVFSEKCSYSNDFNFSLISNFLKILKNDRIDKFETINCENNYICKEKNFKNFLQNYYSPSEKILIKVNSIFEKIYNLYAYYKKIPIVEAANVDPAFNLNGFFIKYFSKLNNLKLINSESFSNDERDKLIKKLKDNKLNFDIFLSNYDLSSEIKKNIINFYFEFLKFNYPICFLENLNSNFKYQENILKKFNSKKIYSSDDESSISTLSYFVSKNLNFEIVKFQHSGHYGYLKDTLEIDQIELKNTDTFISNGWNEKVKKYDEKSFVNFIKLPSPLLSEKKKYFKSYKIYTDKKFDFLFLPQFVKPFTNPIQGIANFRRDVIKEYLNEFWELADCLSKNNFKASIKFYNRVSKKFIKNNLNLIEKKYSNTFSYQSNFNKGLSKELVNTGNVILLDQPGTAFIECLNYNIPVMVYWNKSFCEPSDNAIELFNQLNKVGIVHYNTKTLIESYKLFKNNRNEWLDETKRKDTIKLFCDNYAFTDLNWSKAWKKFLI